jgi:hypothetical protein
VLKNLPLGIPSREELEARRNRAMRAQEQARRFPKPDVLSELDELLVENTDCDLGSKYKYCNCGWHFHRRFVQSFAYWTWSAYERCPKSADAQQSKVAKITRKDQQRWGGNE